MNVNKINLNQRTVAFKGGNAALLDKASGTVADACRKIPDACVSLRNVCDSRLPDAITGGLPKKPSAFSFKGIMTSLYKIFYELDSPQNFEGLDNSVTTVKRLGDNMFETTRDFFKQGKLRGREVDVLNGPKIVTYYYENGAVEMMTSSKKRAKVVVKNVQDPITGVLNKTETTGKGPFEDFLELNALGTRNFVSSMLKIKDSAKRFVQDFKLEESFFPDGKRLGLQIAMTIKTPAQKIIDKNGKKVKIAARVEHINRALEYSGDGKIRVVA